MRKRKNVQKNDRIFPIAYPNYNYNEYKGRLEELWGTIWDLSR